MNNPKQGKKIIRSTLYLKSKFVQKNGGLYAEEDPDGFLYSLGKYRTKILPQDLPEWFVYGYMYKRHGYMSAKDVRHLLYVPNYTFENHLHKYDMLYISYDEPITPFESGLSGIHYNGYKHVLSGPVLPDFMNAVGQFSDIDTCFIQSEIKRKRNFYEERKHKWLGR